MVAVAVAVGRGLQRRSCGHVLMLAYPATGHMNPMLELAMHVARRGVTVTFVTFDHAVPQLAARRGDFGALDVRMAAIPDGLPLSHGLDYLQVLFHLNRRAEAAADFLALIRRLNSDNDNADTPPVGYVVYNHFLFWAAGVAADLGIPHALFWTQSASVFSLYLHFLDDEEGFRKSEILRLTGSRAELQHEDLPQPLREGQEYFLSHLRSHFVGLEKLPWILANSFYELEPWAFDFIRSKSINFAGVGPCICPSFLSHVSGEEKEDRDSRYLQWLDEQEHESVVYVAFGSLTTFSAEQVAEIALGIKNSGVKFLWVIRGMEDMIPEGFAEETQKTGLMVKWCDQLKVLFHASTGGFVTHCGWNSTLESLCAGIPVATFPAWADQNTNSKFLCQEWKTGIRLEKTTKENRETVGRREIQTAMRALVSKSREAKELRINGAKWREAARKATDHGGSSYCNLSKFVDDVIAEKDKIPTPC